MSDIKLGTNHDTSDDAREDANGSNDIGPLMHVVAGVMAGDASVIRWVTIVSVMLGLVLLVIGTNMPSVVITAIGIAVLIIIGTVRFVMARNGQTSDDVISESQYRKDLMDTLAGYGLDGKYTEADIAKSSEAFANRHAADDDNRDAAKLGKES
jgi:membrane-bound ClpP family serine protease